MTDQIKQPSILILDDEELAKDYLKETIEEVQSKQALFQNFKILSTTDQNNFWRLIKENLPKIIFLDIQMPEKTGIEIAEEIRIKRVEFGYSDKLPLIVFCTAYDQFAYKAFQVEAMDYLLKPVDTEKITHIFEKIQETYSNILQESIETIKVPTNGIEIDLPLKEVIYFKADRKYISVLTDKKEFLINTTLLNLEEKYPSFVKIHRAYLVNPAYILKFFRKDNHWFLSLKNHEKHLEEHLPVSRRQKQEIEGKLNYNDLFSDI